MLLNQTTGGKEKTNTHILCDSDAVSITRRRILDRDFIEEFALNASSTEIYSNATEELLVSY